jgi:hypothetical protein
LSHLFFLLETLKFKTHDESWTKEVMKVASWTEIDLITLGQCQVTCAPIHTEQRKDIIPYLSVWSAYRSVPIAVTIAEAHLSCGSWVGHKLYEEQKFSE